LGKVRDVFVDAVVVYAVARRLGPQEPIVAHVLFGKAVPVMAADHRVGQVEIFDHRLQLALVLFGHFAAEDGGDLLGLPDVPIQVQQSLGEFLHGGATMEDQVVAILHLGEKQTMLTASVFAFLIGDEGSEGSQPFLTALQQVAGGERVGQLLETCWVATPQEGVGGLLEVDTLFRHADRQPMVLVEAYPC